MARPRPVPLCRRAGPLSACSNSAKMRSIASGCTPGPVSRTAKRSMISDVSARANAGRRLQRERNPAAFGKLDGVAHEIHQDLADAHLVADHRLRQLGARQPADFQALVAGARRQQLDHSLRGVGDFERRGPELDLAGLDLGEIENFVDQRQKGLGRRRDGAGIGALLGRQLGVEQQPGHAEDAVHRGSDLVAHRGEEAGFRLACLHRLIARLLQLKLRRALLGDVAADALDLAGCGPARRRWQNLPRRTSADPPRWRARRPGFAAARRPVAGASCSSARPGGARISCPSAASRVQPEGPAEGIIDEAQPLIASRRRITSSW